MNKLRLPVLGMAAVLSTPAFADNDIEALQKQLDAIKQDYESRISELEQRLEKAEMESKQAPQKEPEIQLNVLQTISGSLLAWILTRGTGFHVVF